MFDQPLILVGQMLSIAAVVTGFISFQMKKPSGILTLQIVTALLFSAHYLMIGAMTAAVLNFIAAIQSAAYYIRNRKQSRSLVIPVVFTLLVVFTGILTYDGWYSVLLTAGLIINAIGLALPDPQNIRKLYLIKSPLCLIYNTCVLSSGGIIYEAATFISAVIGIAKNKKRSDPQQ